MNIQELEQTIILTRQQIKNSTSWKRKNDLAKYLKRLIKEKNDYYRFKGGKDKKWTI